MPRVKASKEMPRMIWRMSEDHPQGAYVLPSQPRSQCRTPVAAHECSLVISSLELLFGADVVEVSMDTLPGDWIDAFKISGADDNF